MQFPIDEISDILDLAKKAGGALKIGFDINERLQKVFGGKEPVSDNETQRLVTDLLGELKQAHFANLALQAQLSSLLQQASNAQRMEAELARYELWRAPGGAVVYRLKKNDGASSEPEHYICPNCKEAGRKSILQGHHEAVQCIPCNHWYILQKAEVAMTVSRQGSSFWDEEI